MIRKSVNRFPKRSLLLRKGPRSARDKEQFDVGYSDLHVAYGQIEVLHGLNVSVAPNEIVG